MITWYIRVILSKVDSNQFASCFMATEMSILGSINNLSGMALVSWFSWMDRSTKAAGSKTAEVARAVWSTAFLVTFIWAISKMARSKVAAGSTTSRRTKFMTVNGVQTPRQARAIFYTEMDASSKEITGAACWRESHNWSRLSLTKRLNESSLW